MVARVSNVIDVNWQRIAKCNIPAIWGHGNLAVRFLWFMWKLYLLRRGKYHYAKRLALHAKRSIGTDIECVVNMVVSFTGLPHRWSDIQWLGATHGTKIMEPYTGVTPENSALLELAIGPHTHGWPSDEKLEAIRHALFVSGDRNHSLRLVFAWSGNRKNTIVGVDYRGFASKLRTDHNRCRRITCRIVGQETARRRI